jgi:integrase
MGDFSDYSEASKLTLGDLLLRYKAENKHRRKKDWQNEEYKIKYILNDTISDTNCLKLSTKHLTEFRERRLMTVGGSTFNKDLSFISSVIQVAINDWGIYFPSNPCRAMKREKEPKPRTRVLEDSEQKELLEACALVENPYIKPMVQFSIETAVRQGELLKIKYNNINFRNRTLLLSDTKNGEDRTIPLSEKAFLILQSQPRQLDRSVFPMTKRKTDYWWKEALGKTKIKGFRWHDLRRHACTLLFEKGLSVPEVQLMSGHLDPKVLLNTYVKLDPAKLVKKLG